MRAGIFSLAEVAAFLDGLLEAAAYAEIRGRDGRSDQNGIFRWSDRPVSRIALALEPWIEMERAIQTGQIDAIFLHRPWRMTPGQLAALDTNNVGVLAYHLSFDEHLTIGFNPSLAETLNLQGPLEVLGFKEGRPLGMLGCLPVSAQVEKVVRHLRQTFGGLETARIAEGESARLVEKLAVAGAMTDALVREACARGVGLYITGQWRQPATAAVEQTGMQVAVVGHLRSERWGLHALAGILRERMKLGVTIAETYPPHLAGESSVELR